MESINKKVLTISIVLSLLTALLIYVYVGKSAGTSTDAEYRDVFIAVRTMVQNYKITESDIKQVKISKDMLNIRAITKKTDIIGKRIKESIIVGEQILLDRLMDENKTTLSFNIPAGKRAVSINVNEQISVANLFRPGDFVDVVASVENEVVENASSETVYPRISKIILQKVEILAMAQDQIIVDEKLKEAPKTVTLAVSPADAEKLVYASEYGVLRLLLRPADDKAEVNTAGVVRGDIFTGKGVYTVPK